ncbi:MAG: hypothetical protein AAGF74_11075 [Pseudomonadota bacterium]
MNRVIRMVIMLFAAKAMRRVAKGAGNPAAARTVSDTQKRMRQTQRMMRRMGRF